MASDVSSNGLDEGDGPILSAEDEPRGREVDSDGSVYEPESIDEDEPGDAFQLVKPEPGEDPISLAHIPPSSPPWSPFKRPAEAFSIFDSRPFKRTKAEFNREYLDLLNVDIEDAAAQYVPHDGPDLPPSQIGLTVWTPLEKEIFFEALSRLGRAGLPGIARRIGTKSELEVLQYLRVLEDAVAARKQSRELKVLNPVEFPAAVEVSPNCLNTLELAADAISLRQDQHEDAREERRWGESWLISPFNYKGIEEARDPDLPSVQLFRASSWLRLSERIFMNASFPENNWQHVSDDNPSIRATALEDFYSLAVSLTRRLVSATIYVTSSRIRAKKALYPHTRGLVWPKDVEAAALSIGLKKDKKRFWAGCARRLKLAVFDDGAANNDEDEIGAILSFDEVETALGVHDIAPQTESTNEESEELMSLSDTPSLDELSDLEVGDAEHAPDIPDTDTEIKHPDESESEPEVDEEDVRLESRELLLYTAFDRPKTTRTRLALESRIRSELAHVAHADAMDARASYREEKRLWEVLGLEPLVELEKIKRPRTPRGGAGSVEDMYPPGIEPRDWRAGVRYVGEWETPLDQSGEGDEG